MLNQDLTVRRGIVGMMRGPAPSEFRVLLAAELIEKVYEKLNSNEPNESMKGRIQESGDNTDIAWIGYEESQL